jgi:recombination protein RecT
MADNSNTQQAQSPTSQALAKVKSGGEQMIEQYQGSFAMVLPSHFKPDMFVRLSQGLLRRDKDLARAANNNPGSFLSALLDCARLGLEPGDTYHLAVFGGEVTGIVDYRGEIELMHRAGVVASIKAEVVYSDDVFEWEPGTMDRPLHKPDWFGERGEMIGVYAYGVLKDGTTSRVVVMSKPEVHKVRALAKNWNRQSSPWSKWPDRMWLKTAIHQLAKFVPSSAEYREAAIRAEAQAQTAAGQIGVSLPAPDFTAPEIPEANPTTDTDDDVIDAEIVDDYADDDPERPFS